MSKTTIEIDRKWQRLVRSRLYHVVAPLQGIAITLAPFLLWYTNKNPALQAYEMLIVPVCFALILLVPLFYFKLGGAVAQELLEQDT